MMMDVDYDTNPRMDWEAAPAGKISNNVRALCATCKQVLGDYSRFKNCTTCREKARTKKHLAAQRKQERQVWAIEALAGLSDEEGDGSGAEENHATRPGGAPPVKKKPKFFSELDGEERDVALLEMKNGLKRKFGKKMVAPPSKPTQSSGKEYQTASALYDTLKRKVQASPASKLQFHGYHTIVANQDINNRKRTKMVVDDVRKIVRVPFDLGNVQKSQNADTNSYALIYPCACLGYDTVTPAAAAPIAIANTSIKGTQGDLIRQARARLALSGAGAATGGQPAVTPARVRRECGGRVYVKSKDDNSHPLGILGQRITVRVQHS